MRSAVRQELYHSKTNFGKEKVKFWMLYQALTTMNLYPGKEIGECQSGTIFPVDVPKWPNFPCHHFQTRLDGNSDTMGQGGESKSPRLSSPDTCFKIAGVETGFSLSASFASVIACP